MPSPPSSAELAVLWSQSTQRADAFAGFDKKRGHRMPDEHAAGAVAFYRRLAEGDVAREIEERFAALRAHLGYKRRQLQVTVGDDAAAIATPDFEFHLVVGQDPVDPRRVLFRRTIQGVRTPSILQASAFMQFFGAGFDGLDLGVAAPIEVGDLIDDLEEREPPGWTLEYGHAATSLILRHPDLPLSVHVTSSRFRLAAPRPLSADVLLEAADAALATIGGSGVLGAAAFDR
jgi:hypothetical protein